MKKNLLFGFLMMLGAANAQTIDNAFFDKVDYRGAFGTTDWTAGWSNFTPKTTPYAATQATIVTGDITKNVTVGSPAYVPSSFADAALMDPFFTKVDYVGAFGQTNWMAQWSNFTPKTTVYEATNATVSGEITSNTTWTKDKVYLLNGWVYVRSGATLTIEAGTLIRGDKTTKAALIVEKGAKLIANGTAAEPIVFTSNQAVGNREPGDWGGVILCGNAKINVTGGSATIEGGVGSTYGGTNDADNSGSIKYVRIEFPGYPFEANKEINGLTFGGVGSATTVDYVQVSYSGDDSFEWFGGTVNAKHLIAFGGTDDDFDTDFGFSGKLQFGVSLRDAAYSDVIGKSNCFESDNDGNGTNNTPFTTTVFSNFSSFGPRSTSSVSTDAYYQAALNLKKNTKIQIYNSVFAGWVNNIKIESDNTKNNFVNGDIKIKNCVFSGASTDFTLSSVSGYTAADLTTLVNTPAFGNKVLASNSDLLVNNPFNMSAPDFRPFGTYLLTGWNYVKDGNTFTVTPGVTIRGDKSTKAALIIEKGAKLVANGTVSEPIVFTSNQLAGNREPGDWGGVILCGKAKINVTGGSATIEGGVGSTYGGTDDADNSGSIKYVRIEFPGYPFEANKEINGLTFGGVGSATAVDYVQVSYSGDDSFEWFGGAVNAKHLIAFGGTDDDFDTDFGYSGMVQYAVSLRDANYSDVIGKSNCFESDNDGNGTTNTPYTTALFSNVSSFGPRATSSTSTDAYYQAAINMKKNTKLQVYNTILAGWVNAVKVESENTKNNIVNGDAKIRNTAYAGMSTDFAVSSITGYTAADLSTLYNTASYKNVSYTENSSLQVVDPFNLNAPNFMLSTNSPMLIGSNWYVSTSVLNPAATVEKLKIYPNPAKSEVNVVLPEFNGVTTIDVKDLTGRTVVSRIVSNTELEVINVSDLKQGIYMLVARQGNTVYNQKLTIR